MNRRGMLGTLGVGAAGLVGVEVGAGSAQAGLEEPHHDHIKTMLECAMACNMAAHHCLGELAKGGEGHPDHHAKSHEAAADCQEFCAMAATLAARSSPFAKYAHTACADACRDCAAACGAHDAAVMKACVAACQACEKVCRSMTSAHH